MQFNALSFFKFPYKLRIKLPWEWGQLCFMIDNLKFKLGITPASRASSETKLAKLMLLPIANQEKLPE